LGTSDLDFITLNGRILLSDELERIWEESVLVYSFRYGGYPRKSPFRIADAPVKILTKYLLDINLEPYR
jgi:hypothetical protein